MQAIKLQNSEPEAFQWAKRLVENGRFEEAYNILCKDPKVEFLGAGHSRSVYAHEHVDYVLKIDEWAFHNEDVEEECYLEIEQNRHEIIICEQFRGHPFVPEMLDFDRTGNSWIEVEYLEQVDFLNEIPPKEEIRKFANLISEFHEGLEGFSSPMDEYTRSCHWGRDKLGNLKILDLGL